MGVSDNPVDAAQILGTAGTAGGLVAAGCAVMWRFFWSPYSRRRSAIAQLCTGSRGAILARLDEVELADLGVREPRDSTGAAHRQPPYASRHDLDPLLEKTLSRKRFVILHGPSAAGKSRSLVQAARRVLGERRVLIPDAHTDALRTLLSVGAVGRGTLIWLSDLERHIAAGVNASILERLLEIKDVLILATIRDSEYQRLAPAGELRPQGRDVVELARTYGGLVKFKTWDATDRDNAARQYAWTHPEISGALNKGLDLGVYLVAGAELVERLEAGEPPASGVAVVRAAADWYLAGMARPAPQDLVRKLYPSYLPSDDAALLASFDLGLEWSCVPVSGVRTVTYRTDGSGLEVHDYVLDHWATHPVAPIPDTTWDTIAHQVGDNPEALNTVAVTAADVHHNSAAAERLFRRAAGLDDSTSMLNLGLLLVRRGDLTGSEHWYRKAVARGDDRAMCNLGTLLAERGDTVEAEECYRTAADLGQALGMYNLGLLLAEQGRRDEAEVWLLAAARLNDPQAMCNLGTLLGEKGNFNEAERWFRRSAELGEPNGMFNLGLLLRKRNDAEAEQWYAAAADLGNDDAMLNLGVLLAKRGQADAAEHWYRAAVDHENTAAMNNLGVLLHGRGEIEEADRIYRRAADRGSQDAMSNLGALHAQQGDEAGAERWFRAAAGGDQIDGMINLGDLLRARGDRVEAEHWYRTAINHGNIDAVQRLAEMSSESGLD